MKDIVEIISNFVMELDTNGHKCPIGIIFDKHTVKEISAIFYPKDSTAARSDIFELYTGQGKIKIIKERY